MTARRRVGPPTAAPAAKPRPRQKVVVEPATPSRWSELERLFGDRGACAGCWCMYWRQTASEWSRLKGSANRKALRSLVAADKRPGVIAYVGGEPAGWCAVAPRSAYVRLGGSRILAPIDDAPVWSIVCFFVARPFRRSGITEKLIRGAVALARAEGAKLIEGYPNDPRDGRMADVFAFTGLAGPFRRAGFKEIARRSPTRPIMRRRV